MKKYYHKILLLIIILLAVFLRFFRIDQVPARMTHDEMSLGYNAYSILKTGRDEWGRSLPLDFEAFGDHKLPAYIYLTIPFVTVLGLTPLAVKMVSLISGILIVYLTYQITKYVFQKDAIALNSSLMMAISPWAIHISRMALESNLALMFFLSGILFWVKNNQKNCFRHIFLTALFWGLTFYSYIAYRLIIILIVGFFGLYYVFFDKNNIKKWLTLSLLLFITISPLVGQLLNGAGTARLQQVSLFTNPGIAMTVDEKRSIGYLVEPNFLPKLTTIFFNKPSELLKDFASNYFSFLSPGFLFLQGDEKAYLANPGYGEFLWPLLPFYFIGLYFLLTYKSLDSLIIKVIYLVAVIPAALVEAPQIIRGSALMPLIGITLGLGMWQVYQWLKPIKGHKLIIGLFGFLTLFISLEYLIDYYYIYPAQYDNAAYPLDRRVAKFIQDRETKYDRIVIDTDFPDSYILLAFYNKFDPNWLQQNIIRYPTDSYGFSHPQQIGKYYFVYNPTLENWCHSEQMTQLVVARPTNKQIPTAIIYNYVHVHPQAKIYTCPNEIIEGPPMEL